MKKTKELLLSLAAVAALSLNSCDDDDDPSFSTITPSISLPGALTDISKSDSAFLDVANISNGVSQRFDLRTVAPDAISLEDGLYNMTLTIYTSRPVGETSAKIVETSRDAKQNVRVSGGNVELSFAPKKVTAGDGGLVIAELCLNSKLADGLKSYRGDAWFRIFNNSADTVYADGMCIFESAFKTTSKQDYTPDVMGTDMVVCAIYKIPGNGKDVAVAPGASLLLADVAKDHRADNSLSFDLSKANFEWYDETEKNLDIDVQDVPNLTCVWKASNTIWQPNTQGNTAFGLGRIGGETGGVSDAEYVSDFKYDGKYILVTTNKKTGETIKKEMSVSGYMFPNDWIIDAVTLSPTTQWAWNVTDQSIDAGHVSLGSTGTDKNRLGISARRKVSNGSLADTNNSSEDFEAVEADPYHVFK